MAINNINGTSNPAIRSSGQGSQTQASSGKGDGGGKVAAVGQTDSVSITDTAARMQAIEARLETVPVVDAQRVESIRAQIADGSYKIDAENVADKLLQMESALDAVTSDS